MANDVGQIVKSITNLGRRVRKLEAQSWRLSAGATIGELYSQFMTIRNLAGFWPGSQLSTDPADLIYDWSGRGHHVWRIGTHVGLGLENNFAYLAFSSGDYNGREWSPDLMPYGNGISVGGWFRITTARTTYNDLLCNGLSAGNDRAYALTIASDSRPYLRVSSDGTTGNQISVFGIAMEPDMWYFLWGQWTASTKMSLFQNGTIYENTTSIPASINPTAGGFGMGAQYDGANPVETTVWMRCAFVALEDDYDTMPVAKRIFQATRGVHGV